MNDGSVIGRVAAGLALRPSRRGLLGFTGSTALAVGLWLSGASLAEAAHCAQCGGGPCHPCVSPHPSCFSCPDTGGCPEGYSSSQWSCCNQQTGEVQICAECTKDDDSDCCHCFVTVAITC